MTTPDATPTRLDLTGFSPHTRDLILRTEELVTRYPDSEVTAIPEDGDYDFRLIVQGLITCQVCTRKTGEDAADWLTTVRPPGTSENRWFLVEDTEPVACADFPDTHRHFFVEC